jgi:hypothetical protein
LQDERVVLNVTFPEMEENNRIEKKMREMKRDGIVIVVIFIIIPQELSVNNVLEEVYYQVIGFVEIVASITLPSGKNVSHAIH